MVTQEQEKAGGKKMVVIIVNGRPKEVYEKELSFEEIVNLAFDNNPPTGDNIVITVTFTKGPGAKKEGSLLPGDTVKIRDRMVFNVSATDKS